jgi:hypothetical protein
MQNNRSGIRQYRTVKFVIELVGSEVDLCHIAYRRSFNSTEMARLQIDIEFWFLLIAVDER